MESGDRPDLLALDREGAAEAPTLARRDEIKAGVFALAIPFGLDDEILKPDRARLYCRPALNVRLTVRHFAHVVIGLFELIERDALNLSELNRTFPRNTPWVIDLIERQVRSPTLKTFSTHLSEAADLGPEKSVPPQGRSRCGFAHLARILERER